MNIGSSYKWSLSDFELSPKPLSVNSYAQVYLGRFKKDNPLIERMTGEDEELRKCFGMRKRSWVAIKVWDKYQLSRPQNDAYRKTVIQERQILSQLSSKSMNSNYNDDRNEKCWTAPLYMSFVDSHNLYMVMEFCGNGRHLKYNEIDDSSSWMIADFISEILSALEWIHFQHGIVHGDLKPSNILIAHDHTVKLIDFGAATITKPSSIQSKNKNNIASISSTTIMMGTADYVAPEVLHCKNNTDTDVDYNDISYLCARDLWSLGCILYYLYVGESPFHAESDYLAMEKILSPSFFPLSCENTNSHKIRHNIQKIPQSALEVIHSLIIRDPPRTRMGAMDHHHKVYSETNQYMSLRQMDFFSNNIKSTSQRSHLPTPYCKLSQKLPNNTDTNHNYNSDYGPMVDGASCDLDFFAI